MTTLNCFAKAGRAGLMGAALVLGVAGVPVSAQDDPAVARPVAQNGEGGGYRLVAGDVVHVTLFGEGEGWELRIDLDGAVRLPGVGRTELEGLNLDAAEARLSSAVEASGFFIAPRLSVSVLEYAPVLVTGAVREPGAFAYAANLTAGAAAGLAGGVAIASLDGSNQALTTAQLGGELRNVEIQLQQSAIRLARIEAQLEGRREIDFDPATGMPVTSVDRALVDELLAVERAILAEEAAAAAELISLEQEELTEVEAQIRLLHQRVEVQDIILGLLEEERAASEELDARGLRTRSAMTQVARSDADAQARLLEIEAALSQARSRRSAISQSITRQKTERRLSFLEAAARERTELERLVHKRRTTLEKRLIVGDPVAAMLAEAAGPEVTYAIRRRLDGAVRVLPAQAETEMRPGDALTVTVTPVPVDTAGGPAGVVRSLN